MTDETPTPTNVTDSVEVPQVITHESVQNGACPICQEGFQIKVIETITVDLNEEGEPRYTFTTDAQLDEVRQHIRGHI